MYNIESRERKQEVLDNVLCYTSRGLRGTLYEPQANDDVIIYVNLINLNIILNNLLHIESGEKEQKRKITFKLIYTWNSIDFRLRKTPHQCVLIQGSVIKLQRYK